LRFHECSQYFIGAQDETLPVTMRIHNPDRSCFNVEGSNPAQAETGVMEPVGDNFPIFQRCGCVY
jgi:hypothetical protein